MKKPAECTPAGFFSYDWRPAFAVGAVRTFNVIRGWLVSGRRNLLGQLWRLQGADCWLLLKERADCADAHNGGRTDEKAVERPVRPVKPAISGPDSNGD